MSGADVHFEVFVKAHAKTEWALKEARTERGEALALAEQVRKTVPGASVRVTREQWNETTGAFSSVTIYEQGPEKYRRPKDEEAEPDLPCRTPDDIRGPAGRDTVRRVLSGWLERQEVCPLELVYRPDLIAVLDSTESELQHAIQQVAVARARDSDKSVHELVRRLTELVEKAFAQARREAAAKTRVIDARHFGQLAGKIMAEGGPEQRMRRAIAERLAEVHGLSRKAETLLDFHDQLADEPDARAFGETHADAFLAELLSFDRTVSQMLAPPRDLGDSVDQLTSIFSGAADHDTLRRAQPLAKRLAAKFKAGSLEASRAEIARRILDALRSAKRLRPSSVNDEITMARALAHRLIAASGPLLSPDALTEAFTQRSARLLSPALVEDALADAPSPPEQIARLIAMEDNLVGDENKRRLAGYVRQRLRTHASETWFARGPGQPLERLARLTALQQRAKKGTFAAVEKAEMSEAFDQMGLMVIREAKLFERIGQSSRPVLDRAAGLLKIAAQGVLPEGRCREDARFRAMALVTSEEGMRAAQQPANAAQLKLIGELAAALEAMAAKTAPAAGEDDEAKSGEAA